MLTAAELVERQYWGFLPNTVPPFANRLPKDAEFRALAIQRATGNATPDEKASLTRLLSRAGGLSPELQRWVRQELERQAKAGSLTVLSCNIVAGSVRPLVHALLDAFEGRP